KRPHRTGERKRNLSLARSSGASVLHAHEILPPTHWTLIFITTQATRLWLAALIPVGPDRRHVGQAHFVRAFARPSAALARLGCGGSRCQTSARDSSLAPFGA